MHFSAAEGADGHCEMGNRSLLNRRVLDGSTSSSAHFVESRAQD